MDALQLHYIDQGHPMKSATLPALRVDPKLREAAERALRPDETLSRLMETALENYIAQRAAEDDFLARGLRSARHARQHDSYVSAAEVVGKLEKKLALAHKNAKAR
jgi:predicted transcriptional regulator